MTSSISTSDNWTLTGTHIRHPIIRAIATEFGTKCDLPATKIAWFRPSANVRSSFAISAAIRRNTRRITNRRKTW